MHPSIAAILKHFRYEHLPEDIKAVSAPICALAHDYVSSPSAMAEGAEFTTGLRKLLEAKDCFVRAAIEKREQNGSK